MKKKIYPAWFPYPSSWLNAILLLMLFAIEAQIIRAIIRIGIDFTRLVDAPALLILFIIVALLSPIIFVAVTHHLLQHFLHRFSPSLTAPEMGIPRGFLPGLMSWWEGIWAWSVITISTLVTAFGVTIAVRYFDVDLFDTRMATPFGCVWLTVAAMLYQISYLVEQRLMAVSQAKLK